MKEAVLHSHAMEITLAVTICCANTVPKRKTYPTVPTASK